MSYAEALHYRMIYFDELNGHRQMSANEFPLLLLTKPDRPRNERA